MTKRCKLKLSEGVAGKCLFCDSLTNYIMYYPDNSEVFACSICASREGKIRRFRRLKHLSQCEVNSIKKIGVSCVKFRQNKLFEGGIKAK